MSNDFKQEFADLDRAIARAQEISQKLDAYAAAHGRQPTERETSDIEERAALRHPQNGCVAMLLGAAIWLGAAGWAIGGAL